MSRTYVCIYKLLSPHKKMPLQHGLMYLQALRSHLVAVRIISAHNNAPPRMAGQGVMCHGRHIKAGLVEHRKTMSIIRTAS